MKIQKITTGFVVQVFDTDKKEWESQEFVCGDECTYENQVGETLDEDEVSDRMGVPEPYLPYVMVQPKDMD